MQARKSVHPAAPAGMQLQIPEAGMPPMSVDDGADVAGSPGQSNSPLNKVKNKAKKLREKIKKVTSPTNPTRPNLAHVNEQNGMDQRGNAALSSHPPQCQPDNAEGRTASHSNDEDDNLPQGVKQSNHNYSRLPGAMANSGAGTEGVVHDGIPTSAVAAGANGSQSGGSLDRLPISCFKSDGPIGALQATPTEYHYTPDDDVSSGLAHVNLPVESNPQSEDETDLSRNVSAVNAATGANDKARKSPRPVSSERFSVKNKMFPGEKIPPDQDMYVPYAEDIVKPKFGQSSTSSRKKIAGTNEDVPGMLSADTSRSAESYSSLQEILNKSPPENTSLIFNEDETKNAGISCVPSKFGIVPNEGNTSGVEVFNGEREQQRSGERRDYHTSSGKTNVSLENETYPGPGCGPPAPRRKERQQVNGTAADNRPLAMAFGGMSTNNNAGFGKEQEGQLLKHLRTPNDDGKQRALMEEEIRGKCAEDKFYTLKEIEESDERLAGDSNDPVNSTEAMNLPHQKHFRQHSEATGDEYFDPNCVSDNQFQEGFDLGSGEADKELLDGTLAGATLDKLSDLADTVVYKLGLINDSAAVGENMQEANTGNAASAIACSSTEKPLSDMMTCNGGGEGKNSLLNGNEKAGNALDHHHQPQQTVGTLQNLKNVVAAKLGYGGLTQEPTDSSPRSPASTLKENFPAAEQGKVVSDGLPASEEGKVVDGEVSGKGQPHQTGGTLQGLKNAVASKLGYGMPMEDHTSQGEDRPQNVDKKSAPSLSVSPPEAERPFSPRETAEEAKNANSLNGSSSYTQMLFNTAAAAKDYLWSPKGNSHSQTFDVNERRNLHDARVESPATVV